MGISTETVLRGTLVMLPWIISFAAAYITTNRTNPESPMLSKRNSIILFVLGLLLYLTGTIFINAGVLDGIIPEFKTIGVGYKILGILLVFYGHVGKGYKLVKIKR